jgi:CBS domain-containing protein
MSSTTVQQILSEKGNTIYSVRPDVTVRVALEKMAQHEIGGVLVIDEGKLVGIFTERDYARKVALRGLGSQTTSVSELMTRDVATISPSQNIDEVMGLMSTRRFRHLPVVDGQGALLGIITIGDVIKAVIAEHEETIRHLSGYISGDLTTG